MMIIGKHRHFIPLRTIFVRLSGHVQQHWDLDRRIAVYRTCARSTLDSGTGKGHGSAELPRVH